MATTFTQITEQDDVSFQVMNDLTDEIVTAIDAVINLPLGSANQLLGINAANTAREWKTLSGTANQITITHAANSITLALPQNIHTAASPTFVGLTLSGMSTAGFVKNSAAGVLSGGNGVINSVQRGAGNIANTTSQTNVTITEVVLGKSFITFSGGGTVDSVPSSIGRARLTTTTNLQVDRVGTTDILYFNWEVIEFV